MKREKKKKSKRKKIMAIYLKNKKSNEKKNPLAQCNPLKNIGSHRATHIRSTHVRLNQIKTYLRNQRQKLQFSLRKNTFKNKEQLIL